MLVLPSSLPSLTVHSQQELSLEFCIQIICRNGNNLGLTHLKLCNIMVVLSARYCSHIFPDMFGSGLPWARALSQVTSQICTPSAVHEHITQADTLSLLVGLRKTWLSFITLFRIFALHGLGLALGEVQPEQSAPKPSLTVLLRSRCALP